MNRLDFTIYGGPIPQQRAQRDLLERISRGPGGYFVPPAEAPHAAELARRGLIFVSGMIASTTFAGRDYLSRGWEGDAT